MVGTIANSVVFRDTIYVTGSLENVNGQAYPCAARLTAGGWEPAGKLDGGECSHLAVQGNHLYTAFARGGVNGTETGIDRLENGVWAPLTPTVTGSPRSLVVTPEGIYLLVSVGSWDAARGRVYQYTGGQWVQLGREFPFEMYSLTVFKGAVHVGGLGRKSDDPSGSLVSRWDGSTWQPLDAINGNMVVYSLAADDTYLYAGGFFYSIGTESNRVSAKNLARWDGTKWENLGDGTRADVNQVALEGDAVWTSGNGLWVGNKLTYRLGRYRQGSWHWFDEIDGRPNTIVAQGSRLYALGGQLTWTATGEPVKGVLYYDGTSWMEISQGQNHGLDGTVYALAQYKDDLIVGGAFTRADGQPAEGIARLHDRSWSSVPGISGTVTALFEAGDKLYAGGTLYPPGQNKAYMAARWTGGSSWEFLGSNVTSAEIYSLQPLDDHLYVCGNVYYTPGHSTEELVQLTGTESKSISGELQGAARALVVSNGQLVAGGSFKLGGGLAVWDGTTWSPFMGGLSAPDGYVSWVDALLANGESLYVTGQFTAIGSFAAQYMTRWAGDRWEAPAPGYTQYVTRLAVSDPFVFALPSGAEGNPPLHNVIYSSGGEWRSLGSGANGPIKALLVDGTDVYIGGSFTQVGGKSSNRLAHWRGTLLPTAVESLPGDISTGITVWPNPASGPVRIGIRLDRSEPVRLEVYDLLGRRLAELINYAFMPAGDHQVVWHPALTTAGLHFIRLQVGTAEVVKPVVIVR